MWPFKRFPCLQSSHFDKYNIVDVGEYYCFYILLLVCMLLCWQTLVSEKRYKATDRVSQVNIIVVAPFDQSIMIAFITKRVVYKPSKSWRKLKKSGHHGVRNWKTSIFPFFLRLNEVCKVDWRVCQKCYLIIVKKQTSDDMIGEIYEEKES